MSAKTMHRYPDLSRSFHSLLILATIVIFSVPSPLSAAPLPCASIVPLIPGETWRSPGGGVGDGACFDLSLEAAGILMLDVSTAISAPRAQLRLAEPDAGSSATFTHLRQSSTVQILAGEPGSYRIRVEGQDPRQPLPVFNLTARFAAGITKSETNSEIEVDPDPFTANSCPFIGWSKSETNSEIEVDPDPLTTGPAPSLHDLAGASELLRSHLAELCTQGEVDDHGSALACATDILWGQPETGEIGNGRGDDADVFRFRVRALTPVAIQARSIWSVALHRPDLELVAELYDRSGQQLDVAFGIAGDLRLARTLTPGTYFLRLGGRDGAAGRYSLTVGPPSPRR